MIKRRCATTTATIGALAIGLTMAGCSSQAPPVKPGSHPEAGYLKPYKGELDGKRQISMTSAEVTGEREIEIATMATAGGSKCDRYDVELEETDSQIVINFYFGRIPDADTICKDEFGKIIDLAAGEINMTVETQDVLDKKVIIDGATMKPAPEPFTW